MEKSHLFSKTERKSRSERNCAEMNKTAKPHTFMGERVCGLTFAVLGNNKKATHFSKNSWKMGNFGCSKGTLLFKWAKVLIPNYEKFGLSSLKTYVLPQCSYFCFGCLRFIFITPLAWRNSICIFKRSGKVELVVISNCAAYFSYGEICFL